MDGDVLAAAIAFRLVNALATKTYFQPDEFWQSLEPAHELVYGHGYLTWEWRIPLRSIAHPALFALVYWLADALGLQYAGVLYGPKVFQALCAAVGDWAVHRLARRWYGPAVARTALAVSLASAWNWHMAVRTFSNSLETTLFACALCWWPDAAGRGRLAPALTLAALACVLRPTNVLAWIYLGGALVARTITRGGAAAGARVAVTAAAIGGAVVLANTVLDMWYYRGLVFPLWNFLQFNVIESLSSFYGTSSTLFYAVVALPLMLIVFLPWAVHGWALAAGDDAARAAVFVVAVYSLIQHKEVRFVYPLLPVLHVYAARSIEVLNAARRRVPRRAVFALALAVHVPLALYASLVHQRGVVDVAEYVHRAVPAHGSVFFLMPCHSTPWQSHFHRRDIDIRFLTCEPPIGLKEPERSVYRDEADEFYDAPSEFLAARFSAAPPAIGLVQPWPTHLIFFAALEPTIGPQLAGRYTECARFFNSHVHDDPRRRGDVLVYCATGAEASA
ncbi:Alg9-like mannosyltransferase family-domain-containing protein [Dipodascopsis tothii]|uniref:Alg9-like mannosyltransferase family-domain-containing protein n=1 Tax=Dipodascopsis tothii TaxID=44089 RepID=UPI0034CD8B4D